LRVPRIIAARQDNAGAETLEVLAVAAGDERGSGVGAAGLLPVGERLEDLGFGSPAVGHADEGWKTALEGSGHFRGGVELTDDLDYAVGTKGVNGLADLQGSLLSAFRPLRTLKSKERAKTKL
jgi:hypothetical protein